LNDDATPAPSGSVADIAIAIAAAIPHVRTPRLTLRAFRADDLDRWAAICADPEVMQHIGVGGPVGRDVAWRQMAAFNGEWSLRGYGSWAVERADDGRLIGRVGFLHPHGWPGVELAWLLAHDAWGQGYAQEAAVAARDAGRARLGVGAPLLSLVRPQNTRSIALARRLGARDDGVIDFLGGPAHRYRHP
jgi:RimJ/RimL family protein N-acetyltransferase